MITFIDYLPLLYMISILYIYWEMTLRRSHGQQNNNKIWDKYKKAFVDIYYLRLNMIDNYNYEMVVVDIADHFRLNYRLGCWMLQNKWW